MILDVQKKTLNQNNNSKKHGFGPPAGVQHLNAEKTDYIKKMILVSFHLV